MRARSRHPIILDDSQEVDSSSFRETIRNHRGVEKEDSEYSDSLYASQSSNSATTLASLELPLYSEIDHQLDDLQEMLEIGKQGTYEAPAELDGEERPRSRPLLKRDLPRLTSSHLRLSKRTVQELPAELPALAGAYLPPRRIDMETGSASTRPDLDHSGAQSPSLPCPPITPLSPSVPVISPVRRASGSTGTRSKSSNGNLKMPSTNFHEQRVETGTAKKVKFCNGKKADSVVLSPDCACAAFVFSGQVQVNRIISEWGEIQTLEARVMLTLGKKAGKFIAAYLSSTHLVAISSKEVRTRMLNRPPDSWYASRF